MPGGKGKDTLEVPADDKGVDGRKSPPVGQIVASLDQQQQRAPKYTPLSSQLKTAELAIFSLCEDGLNKLEKKLQEENPNPRQLQLQINRIERRMAEHRLAHLALQQQLSKENRLPDLTDELKTLDDLEERRDILCSNAQDFIGEDPPPMSRTSSHAEVNVLSVDSVEPIRKVLALSMKTIDSELETLRNTLDGLESEPVRISWETFINELEEFLMHYNQGITILSQADRMDWIQDLKKRKTEFLLKKSEFERQVLPRIGAPLQPGAIVSTEVRDKLPKRQLPKFTGEVREWLGFWAIFKQIHEDPTIKPERKFDYLIQSTVPGSQAHATVTSYPLCAVNYQKAVDALRQRFGREKTLIKVYVRDLFKLGVDNATPGKQKLNFIDMVTKLTAQIRNLEQLGVAKERYAQIIYPLVEACLPSHILLAWQRHKNYDEELDKIMDFLQEEVNHDTERQLARSQLATTTPSTSKSMENYRKDAKQKPFTSTAASLLNDGKSCGFCSHDHDTRNCQSAKFLTPESRKIALQKSGVCAVCLENTHAAGRCPARARIKCLLCRKPGHLNVMCYSLQGEETSGAPTAGAASAEEPTIEVVSATNNVTSRRSRLQTLVALLHGSGGKKKRVRVIFDTASERSYITQKVAKEMEYEVTGQETLTHHLFGGAQSPDTPHNLSKLLISSVDQQNFFTFEVSSTPTIARKIEPPPPGPWIEDFARQGVVFTDLHSKISDVDVMIGNDVYGKTTVRGTNGD